jgi:hypothetical protein
MAARAYFRRGDQDLPRRGQFHYEGTQVVTGARGRSVAEAEARRRAQTRTGGRTAAAPPPRQATSASPPTEASASGNPAQSTTYGYYAAGSAAGVSRDARRILEVREAWRRRTNAATWPTLGERLIFALVAWAPIAVVIGVSGASLTGCADRAPACPAYLETAQAIAIALVLGLLVAVPKVAYVGALATVGALFIGLGIVALVALFGVDVPLSDQMSTVVGFALLVGYGASAALVVFRDRITRPWYAGPRP